MKRHILLLPALMLAVSFSACSQSQEIQENKQTQEVQYRISRRQLTHETGDVNLTLYTYNEDGKILSTETLLNGNFSSRVDYAYSEDSTVITQNFTSATGAPSTSEYHSTYDENGNILESSSYSGGRLVGTTYYTYDEQGRETELRGVDADGNLQTLSTRTYDTNGNLIRTELTYGDRVSRNDYSYDQENRCLTAETRINGQLNSRVEYIWNENSSYGTVYNPDGTPRFKTLTVQDTFGNILLEETYDVLGTFQERTCYEYIGTDGSISSGFPEE